MQRVILLPYFSTHVQTITGDHRGPFSHWCSCLSAKPRPNICALWRKRRPHGSSICNLGEKMVSSWLKHLIGPRVKRPSMSLASSKKDANTCVFSRAWHKHVSPWRLDLHS